MASYRIGTGIADITDPAIGTQMFGMADPSQKVTGIESRLYARGFVIMEPNTEQYVALVVAELLSATTAVKAEVLRRLQLHTSIFDETNVMISGTHTHSAPGGYSDHKLYEHTTRGFDPHTFECIVTGIVTAIRHAYANLAPGKIYIQQGKVEECGKQRSPEAYCCNPQCECDEYDCDTDQEMLLLKFVTVQDGHETPIGVLNWHAIHPTDRGQKNTLITGDNKGYAAWLFEQAMGTNYYATQTFVAAFANSNCGDVSGNVEYGAIPDGVTDKARMALHGTQQYKCAQELFDTAHEELHGSLDTRHTRVDMGCVVIEDDPPKRTYPGAIGMAFAAGSTQDSVPRIGLGSLTLDSIHLPEGLAEGEMSLAQKALQSFISSAMILAFGRASMSDEYSAGHFPKPIILPSGLLNPPVTPNVLPLQILKIGNLAVVAIPGEITTMAGRRLRATLLTELQGAGIDYVALATYSNEYSQYITTPEEYAKQHYEGASTLFGPYTLLAYQQELRKLAYALKTGAEVAPGVEPQARSAPTSRRITIRNTSDVEMTVKFFPQEGLLGEVLDFIGLAFATVDIPAYSDRAYFLPNEMNTVKVRFPDGEVVENIPLHSLLTIRDNGSGFVSPYMPPCTSPEHLSHQIGAVE